MQSLPDDCLGLILAKLPRMEDMRSLTTALDRKDLFANALVDRIDGGSFTLVENGCTICNLGRTIHGRECEYCHQLDEESEEGESDEDDSEYEEESSDDTSHDDPTWTPGQP
eukprot:scaffold413_cov134-Isochrysis_galbana.AAC.6